MKIAVYTCITDGYDSLKYPLVEVPELPFYCFTDSPDSVNPPWVPVSIDLPWLNGKDKSRYVKMHPHILLNEYDITLYLDGSIQIVGALYGLIADVLKRHGDIFIYDHPERDCAYEEAAACSHFGHDWIWNISSQMRRYCRQGFPEKTGLHEAFVMIRRNTPRVNELMESWWREYVGGVRRDQLSLSYVSWKKNVPVTSLEGNDPRFNRQYFRFINHPSKSRFTFVVRESVNRVISSVFPHILNFKE